MKKSRFVSFFLLLYGLQGVFLTGSDVESDSEELFEISNQIWDQNRFSENAEISLLNSFVETPLFVKVSNNVIHLKRTLPVRVTMMPIAMSSELKINNLNFEKIVKPTIIEPVSVSTVSTDESSKINKDEHDELYETHANLKRKNNKDVDMKVFIEKIKNLPGHYTIMNLKNTAKLAKNKNLNVSKEEQKEIDHQVVLYNEYVKIRNIIHCKKYAQSRKAAKLLEEENLSSYTVEQKKQLLIDSRIYQRRQEYDRKRHYLKKIK
jgi:hypothetical protein